MKRAPGTFLETYVARKPAGRLRKLAGCGDCEPIGEGLTRGEGETCGVGPPVLPPPPLHAAMASTARSTRGEADRPVRTAWGVIVQYCQTKSAVPATALLINYWPPSGG